MSQTKAVPISALPLPPSTHILTRNLTPDPQTPSTSAFRHLLSEKPSVQRRSRLLATEAHYSYVAPCPQPFPYQIAPPENGEPIVDQVAYVEKWLSDREALHEQPNAPSPAPSTLKKYYPSEKREQSRILVGLSETGLRDCIPHLNVGDAFTTLGLPSLARAAEAEEQAAPAPEEDIAARQELVDVLSGHAVLMSTDGADSDTHWAPWSVRYSGHQFGTWAGQLGDGRAISVLATPHPSDPDLTYELQLKGAGRTPFSRTADGLAVLRSSVREFLCAEAMHALSIPTTRSLSLISLPKLPVLRERVESACVLTRVAPSFIRIGSFEALNPPEGVFFIGGGQQDANWDALRTLGEWVARRVLRLEGLQWSGAENGTDGDPWGTALVLEVARRNAKMVAGWQAYGFMHGVINTDNVSILGLTIDYGPYAFMDVFDSFHICNHTDEEGRYAYKFQPSMIIYALRALLSALSPLIGAEAELGKAVPSGWADGIPSEKLSEWRKKGAELKDEMERVAEEACAVEYGRLTHKRLALRRLDTADERDLVRPLLDLMSEHKLDFHGTFRRLSFFRPSTIRVEGDLNAFIASILVLTSEPQRLDREKATRDWRAWLQQYAARIESERAEWAPRGSAADADVDAEREHAACAANPRFVLRQWVLEEVIQKMEQDADSGKRILRKVLQMACSPFEPWGAEGQADESVLDAEIKEERRYCSMGETRFLGFQCSCSS